MNGTEVLIYVWIPMKLQNMGWKPWPKRMEITATSEAGFYSWRNILYLLDDAAGEAEMYKDT